MFKRVALFAGVMLGIGVIFYLADRLSSPVLWVVGIIAVSTLIQYGNFILMGGNSRRLIAYFKRHSTVRIKLICDSLAHKQAIPNDLSTKEVVALLIISMAQESIDVAHVRASEFPSAAFSDEFFRDMAQVFHDTRAIGLRREFQLQLVGFGENLAQRHQALEWVTEFHKQRELIFKRQAEGIPVIRAPR